MGIKVPADDFFHYTVVREWDEDGHAVALVRYEVIDDPGRVTQELFCECDFPLENSLSPDGEAKVTGEKKDPRQCGKKQGVRRKLFREMHEENKTLWDSLGTKGAVLDIFRRVKSEEYFGQYHPDLIFLGEVAKLLQIDPLAVWNIYNELSAEEENIYGGVILHDQSGPRFKTIEDWRAWAARHFRVSQEEVAASDLFCLACKSRNAHEQGCSNIGRGLHGFILIPKEGGS